MHQGKGNIFILDNNQNNQTNDWFRQNATSVLHKDDPGTWTSTLSSKKFIIHNINELLDNNNWFTNTQTPARQTRVTKISNNIYMQKNYNNELFLLSHLNSKLISLYNKLNSKFTFNLNKILICNKAFSN